MFYLLDQCLRRQNVPDLPRMYRKITRQTRSGANVKPPSCPEGSSPVQSIDARYPGRTSDTGSDAETYVLVQRRPERGISVMVSALARSSVVARCGPARRIVLSGTHGATRVTRRFEVRGDVTRDKAVDMLLRRQVPSSDLHQRRGHPRFCQSVLGDYVLSCCCGLGVSYQVRPEINRGSIEL
jgi:hypothetical protein